MRAARSSSSAGQSGCTSKASRKSATRSRISAVAHLGPQRRQFVHLDDLDVAAEAGALLREVGVDVEHAAVVVAHDAEAVVLHHVADAGGVDPGRDLVPARGVVVQHAGDLVERDSARRLKTLAISGTGQAGQWASHSPVIARPVAQAVERRRSRWRARAERLRMMTGTLARRTTGSTVEDRA